MADRIIGCPDDFLPSRSPLSSEHVCTIPASVWLILEIIMAICWCWVIDLLPVMAHCCANDGYKVMWGVRVERSWRAGCVGLICPYFSHGFVLFFTE